MNLHHNQNLNKFSRILPEKKSSFSEFEDEASEEQIEAKLNGFSEKPYGESLPVQATSNDVREIVRFFKDKPSGLSFVEVLNSEPRRIFEPRKMGAYEYWGIIERSGERLTLTALGNKLAEIVASERAIFEEVISSVPVYVEIIKWINNQNLKIITHPDITEFFIELQKEKKYVNISEAEVVSFFSLCHAAELGVATVGKRGQPARLRIELKRIEEFLSQNKSGRRPTSVKASPSFSSEPANRVNGHQVSEIGRVYVSVAPQSEIAESISSALELADFESVVFSRSEDDDYLQSEKLHKMRVCQAGIIIINDQDCHADFSGKTEINAERLTEITAAAGLFNWRVVIVWNSLLPIPEYLESYSLHLLVNTTEDFKTSYEAVKLLKNMKYQLVKQAD
jgi:hypothetical protein